MSKERHRRATDLFLEARELAGPERKALLDRACAGDDELRALVEGMLGVDEATVSFLNPARPEVEPGPGPGDVPLLNAGDRVGNYVIREKIGEGGFAVVYAAEQEKPVRRKVALKIIKLGMDTNQVIARFEAERQALAMMDHVNVAKVFDAGATDAGRPYFVMEFVAGTPITEHCDRNRLTVAERLALFRQACDAVQHAHQKGVIHRDIKPSNVLVATQDGKAQVKVIDFGLAKAITQRLTEKTIYTEQGQMLGTPEYMSPEQAEVTAENIDTRSDIYSLGVLLYELLTGSLPFDPSALRRAAFAEIQRIIREVEPPKPSTRLSSLGDDSAANAQQRQLDPKALYRELHGDLDWIVMKALEKNRNRRYETASGFADDIRRHLDHEPVVARPPSAGYRIGKFVRRNRLGVTAAVAIVATLLAAAGGVAWTQMKARQAQILASDYALAPFLITRADGLWPAVPENIPDMQAWGAEVDELLTRRTTHAGELSSTSGEDTARLRTLLEQVAHLGDPGGRADHVKGRVESARTLETRSISSPAARALWVEAIESIADPEVCPIYKGLRIDPQRGLLPIGRDPASGLWEFAHVDSGTVPSRDDAGQLAFTEESAIVLVLIPGGPDVLGVQGTDPQRPNYMSGYPLDFLFDVEVEPFFLSKFEMTQAQWMRFTGANPSHLQKLTGIFEASPIHPVEMVSQFDCLRVLPQMDLALPGADQWQYAALAGTDTPWWTGSDPMTLQGAANIMDNDPNLEAMRSASDTFDLPPAPWEDGWMLHGPVNIYRANPFGLHHVTGNVWEWSIRGSKDPRYAEEGLGDGFVLWGGAWSSGIMLTPTGFGMARPARGVSVDKGVRPARDLRRK